MTKEKSILEIVKDLRTKLKNYIENSDKTIPTVAKELGYHRSYLNYFLNSERDGSLKFLENLKIYLEKK